MSEDLQSNRKTRGAQDYSDLGKDIHLRVCSTIVIYCCFSHVSYQVQRGGEESDENSASGSVFLLSRPLTSRLRLQAMSSASFPAGPLGCKRLIKNVSLKAVGGALPLCPCSVRC